MRGPSRYRDDARGSGGLVHEPDLRVLLAVNRARPRQVGVAGAIDRDLLEIEQLAILGTVGASGADRAGLDDRRIDGRRCREGRAAVSALEVLLEPLDALGRGVRRRDRSVGVVQRYGDLAALGVDPWVHRGSTRHDRLGGAPTRAPVGRDRKSTRLNSSHVKISYAVFCLKKKKKKGNGGREEKKKKEKEKYKE